MSIPVSLPTQSTTFTLPGEAGAIEVAVTVPKNKNTNKVIIICHPHPLYGGTMENKVVTTLVRTFVELDFYCLRFNFRGVGQSAGEHDKGIGEANDLAVIIEWLFSQRPDAHCFLAGFSFGAYVAYRVAGQEDYAAHIQQLLLVAPPVQYPEFATLPIPPVPSMVLQGEADEVVQPEDVFAWVNAKLPKAQLIRFSDTSHFFHGKLVDLKKVLIQEFA